MEAEQRIYGDIGDRVGMAEVFDAIRRDVDEARTRTSLTELYCRASYLVTLTHAPSWRMKFGPDAVTLRKVGRHEFRKTAAEINRRAEAIGAEPDYIEDWGE